ncbi:MAG: sensor histidine kinase [Phenylobacterium sp.]|uniref:sensor histidine kinase n=1 Tax=Phenylobacterium sp. TaxID=1871053 RepID=UPI0039195166
MAPGDLANDAGSARQAARERAFRLLAATVAALLGAFACLGAAFLWYDRSTGDLIHTHEVRSGIADVLQALTDAESNQRAYVLTGDRTFLDSLETARSEARRRLEALEALTREDAEQQARLETLRGLMDRRLAIVEETVRLRRDAGDAVAAIRVIRAGEGRRAMEAIRAMVAELEAQEARLARDRARQVAGVRWLAGTALVAFALMLAALFAKAMRDLNLDREAEVERAEQLRALVAERTLLIDEVNHRVKNSLQQIASVVRLQARGAREPAAQEALEKTLDRIMAVGRVHEQLYKGGDKVGVFDAGAYAENLARDLVASLGREDVELVTEVEPAPLDMRQAVPLALILNELVTNALKYGCPTGRAGRIQVSLRADGEAYRLRVADDGDGLPADFARDGRKGLGMRAIEALAKQLGGRLDVERPAAGAAFAVAFPRS